MATSLAQLFNQFFWNFVALLSVMSSLVVLATGYLKTRLIANVDTTTNIKKWLVVIASFVLSWLFPVLLIIFLRTMSFVDMLSQMTTTQFIIFCILVTMVANRIVKIEWVNWILVKLTLEKKSSNQ